MPTILTHAALPLIAGWTVGGQRISAPLIVAGMAAAVAPDLDVIGMALGVPHESHLGHRGTSHSLAVAVLIGIIAAAAFSVLRAGRLQAFLFVTASAASHGLTDMLTNGGRGIAFWLPFSDIRLFAPVRPVQVANIGLRGFYSGSLWPTLLSELLWLVLPALILALLYRRVTDRHIDLARGQS